ncbi:DUF349 domain-containing protein [Kocuria rhizophila]|nr:DUF349 domain-containing protein [Kocuria rhizophila]
MVGDLVDLSTRLDTLEDAIRVALDRRREEAKAHKAEQLARRTAIVEEAEVAGQDPEARWKHCVLPHGRAARSGRSTRSRAAGWPRRTRTPCGSASARRAPRSTATARRSSLPWTRPTPRPTRVKEALIAEAERSPRPRLGRDRREVPRAHGPLEAVPARVPARTTTPCGPGSAPPRTCFFDARTAANEQIDKEFEGNLKVKEQLLTEARQILPVKDLAAAKEQLASIQQRWEEAGRCPAPTCATWRTSCAPWKTIKGRGRSRAAHRPKTRGPAPDSMLSSWRTRCGPAGGCGRPPGPRATRRPRPSRRTSPRERSPRRPSLQQRPNWLSFSLRARVAGARTELRGCRPFSTGARVACRDGPPCGGGGMTSLAAPPPATGTRQDAAVAVFLPGPPVQPGQAARHDGGRCCCAVSCWARTCTRGSPSPTAFVPRSWAGSCPVTCSAGCPRPDGGRVVLPVGTGTGSMPVLVDIRAHHHHRARRNRAAPTSFAGAW